jgi:hypothetical protein
VFGLAAIINEDSCDVPFVNVYCDYRGIYVWEGCEFDIGFSED